MHCKLSRKPDTDFRAVLPAGTLGNIQSSSRRKNLEKPGPADEVVTAENMGIEV